MNEVDRGTREKLWLAGMGLLACLLVVDPVTAGPSILGNAPSFVEKRGDSSGRGISLDEAVARVRRQTNGKILSAETIAIGGREVHRIKVLTETGRVRRLQVDARSGRRVRPGR